MTKNTKLLVCLNGEVYEADYCETGQGFICWDKKGNYILDHRGKKLVSMIGYQVNLPTTGDPTIKAVRVDTAGFITQSGDALIPDSVDIFVSENLTTADGLNANALRILAGNNRIHKNEDSWSDLIVDDDDLEGPFYTDPDGEHPLNTRKGHIYLADSEEEILPGANIYDSHGTLSLFNGTKIRRQIREELLTDYSSDGCGVLAIPDSVHDISVTPGHAEPSSRRTRRNPAPPVAAPIRQRAMVDGELVGVKLTKKGPQTIEGQVTLGFDYPLHSYDKYGSPEGLMLFNTNNRLVKIPKAKRRIWVWIHAKGEWKSFPVCELISSPNEDNRPSKLFSVHPNNKTDLVFKDGTKQSYAFHKLTGKARLYRQDHPGTPLCGPPGLWQRFRNGSAPRIIIWLLLLVSVGFWSDVTRQREAGQAERVKAIGDAKKSRLALKGLKKNLADLEQRFTQFGNELGEAQNQAKIVILNPLGPEDIEVNDLDEDGCVLTISVDKLSQVLNLDLSDRDQFSCEISRNERFNEAGLGEGIEIRSLSIKAGKKKSVISFDLVIREKRFSRLANGKEKQIYVIFKAN